MLVEPAVQKLHIIIGLDSNLLSVLIALTIIIGFVWVIWKD